MNNNTTYEFHPAAEAFPMLSDAELNSLAESIKQEGLNFPITLLDGKILDGRNRLKACEMAGVAPRFKNYEGKNPEQYVWDVNKERRHLTKTQIACIAVVLTAESKEWRKELKKRREKGARGTTNEFLGLRFGVSGTTVMRARMLRELKPEFFDAVLRGFLGLAEAFRMLGRTSIGKPKSEHRSTDYTLEARHMALRITEAMRRGVDWASEEMDKVIAEARKWRRPSKTENQSKGSQYE